MIKVIYTMSVAGLMLLFLALGHAAGVNTPGDDEIVARVNGVAITKADVRMHLEIYERAHGPGLPSGKARLGRTRTAVNALINNVLRAEVAKKMGISVSDEEVEAAFRKKQGQTDEAVFAMMLSIAGGSPAKLRADIRKNLLEMRVRERLMEAVVVSRNDLKAQYEQDKYTLFPEQVKARQIIVLTHDLADQLYRQLQEGADFAKLAETTSTDDSRIHGGDLGWVTIGNHYPPWDDIVFMAKPGEMIRPFRSAHGYHIVLVEQRRTAGWGGIEDQRRQLENTIRAKRSNEEYERRLEDAKRHAAIWVADQIDLDAPVPSASTSR